MEDEIEHFSHKHRLLLNKSDFDFHHTCAACLRYLNGYIYCCDDCGYYLHEICAKLEEEIEHFRHPHSLKLHRIEDDGAFNCDLCQKSCLGFIYRCIDCNFKMDLLCSFKSEIQLPIHDHKLKLQVGNTETEPFFCDFCHTRCNSHRGRIKALKHSSIENEAENTTPQAS